MLELVARRKALIILHQAHSTPARIGRLLQRAGVELDIRRPALGDELPEHLHGYDGVALFGGPMGVNDADPWIRREIDWLKTPLGEGTPFLGICLGAQMLASCLGARVFNYEDRRGQAGYYPIRPTPAGDALCKAKFPRCVYQWHFDGFDLPRGGVVLARGCGDFPNQAFRYGRAAVGLQFHPEVTYQMMCRWTTRGAERLKRPGARPADQHRTDWYQYDRAVAAWLDAFLPAWLDRALPALTEATAVASRSSAQTAPLAAAAYPQM